MRQLFAYFLVLISLSAQAGRIPASDIPFTTWKSYLEHEKGLLLDLFPDAKYLGPQWTKYEEFNVDGRQFPPNRINVLELQCKNRNLYPTHPQQFTKEYIYGVVAKYDNLRLPGKSSSCEISTKNAKAYCIRAMRAVVAVMSDTYEDGCGNLYRGYWLKNYRVAQNKNLSEDNMGTLFALGRTQYPKRNAQFAGEYEDGNSYAVNVKEFLFLGPLLPGDLKRIQDARGFAARAGFRKNGKLWVPKN